MPKISELPTDAAIDPSDLLPFVDVTASRTEATTAANLAASAAFGVLYAPRRYRSGWWFNPDNIVSSSVIHQQGVMFTVPFIIQVSATVDRIAQCITVQGTAGSVVRLGIYNTNANGQPGTLMIDAGTIDGTTSGNKEIVISQALTSGFYWLASVGQGAPGTQPQAEKGPAATVGVPVGRDSLTTGTVSSYYEAGVTGALPATFTTSPSVYGVSNSSPSVQLRFA